MLTTQFVVRTPSLSNFGLPYVVLGMSGSQLSNGEGLSRALFADHAEALLAYVQRLVRGDRQLAEDIVGGVES